MSKAGDADSDFQTYLGYFTIFCNAPQNNDLYELLIQKAKSKDPNDFKTFLEYNLYIFENPQIINQQSPSVPQTYAMLYIMNAFRHLPDIENKWFDQKVSVIQQHVKNTVIIGLESPYEVIRNVCATIIALLANLEKYTWENLCVVLVNNIRTQSENRFRALGSIRCLAELFTFPFIKSIPKDRPLPNFMPELVTNLIFAIGEQSLEIPSRVDACNAFIEITQQFPFLYDIQMIDGIIQIITTSLKNITTDNFFFNLINLLSVLVEKNYNNLRQDDNHTIININTIISDEIANRKGNFKISSIYFLSRFADFENRKDGEKYNFSCSAAPVFVDQLLQCLIDIEDPQNQGPEDPLAVTPHMAAITALRSFFESNSQVIFEHVNCFFHKYIGSQNWVDVHAAIFSIAALCDKPLVSQREEYYDTVKNFLESILPYIIVHAGKNCMCLRTKETSMWIITIILECYPIIADNDELVEKFLALFFDTMERGLPPIILTRSCQIFFNVANQCNKNFLDSKFKEIYERIIDIIGYIQTIPAQVSPSDIGKLFIALDALADNCTNIGNVSYLFEYICGQLLNGNCPSQLISPMCLTISSIIKRINNAIRPNAEQLIFSFIRLIEQTTIPGAYQTILLSSTASYYEMWENILIVLANLIDLIDKNFQTISLPITNSIFNALNSNQPNLIKIALKTIGKLYEFFPSDVMVQYLGTTLDLITFLITTKPPECIMPLRCSIIYVYAKIFRKLGSNCINFDEPKYKEMLTRIDQAWKTNINPDEYFEININITYAYRCLFFGFEDRKDFLKKQSQIILKYIDYIYKNDHYNEELLEQIYELLKKMGDTLQTAINVQINKKYVHKLVEKGFGNPKLEETAKHLLIFLRSL